jgi:hypothetical protein
VTVEDLAVETLENLYGMVEPAAVTRWRRSSGPSDSGDPDWVGTDTHQLRVQAELRREL